jgi:hypothetical protein
MTGLTLGTRRQAMEKVQWYALRWKIEVFHKILKAGCRGWAAIWRVTRTLLPATKRSGEV